MADPASADPGDPFTAALVGFAHELRAAGLTVGSGDVLAYFAAMTPLDPTEPLTESPGPPYKVAATRAPLPGTSSEIELEPGPLAGVQAELEGGEERLEIRTAPFGDAFDGSVRPIPDPAGQAE